jgi:hypothetical protein
LDCSFPAWVSFCGALRRADTIRLYSVGLLYVGSAHRQYLKTDIYVSEILKG